MYAAGMKRLQVMIDEDLDAALERLASDQGASKAALIRRFVRDGLESLPPPSSVPLFGMIGVDDVEPAPIDDVVYR